MLIDLDGVLYTGMTPLPDASAFVSWLRNEGISFRLVTNNATLMPAQYVDKLAGMGISVHQEEVFTSALATARYLAELDNPPKRATVIGEQGLISALENAGISVVDDDPQYVVAGLDRKLTYDKLTRATLAIRAGASFVGTNPDRSLPTERGLLPGAGSILAALTAATDVRPVIVGKPEPLMFHMAAEQLGGDTEDTVMLGDRLDTDIEGAAAAGFRSILVLTGVSTREDLAASAVRPDLVVDSLSDLMAAWPRAA